MNLKLIFTAVVGLVLSALALGCGVKGDPLPPLKPVEISDGELRPRSKVVNSKPSSKTYADDEDDDEEDKDEDEEKSNQDKKNR